MEEITYPTESKNLKPEFVAALKKPAYYSLYSGMPSFTPSLRLSTFTHFDPGEQTKFEFSGNLKNN